MRRAFALGLALAAMTAAAAAQPDTRIHIRHHDGGSDVNDDGWVTREEALAGADRGFDELDINNDGRLNDADHRDHLVRHAPRHRPNAAHDENCTRSEEGAGANRRVTIVCRGDAEYGMAPPPLPPIPPIPPLPPPMFVMHMGDREEFDRNGDGALSREEFRAQQMRFFDASDGNGDGRIRALRPPEPPTPPTPPIPPRRP